MDSVGPDRQTLQEAAAFVNRCGILVPHLPSLPWGHGIPLGLALLCPPAVTKVETQVSKREANRPRASRVASHTCASHTCLAAPHLCLVCPPVPTQICPGVPVQPSMSQCRDRALPHPQTPTYCFPRCSWDAGRPSESNGTLHRREGIRSHIRPPGMSQDSPTTSPVTAQSDPAHPSHLLRPELWGHERYEGQSQKAPSRPCA